MSRPARTVILFALLLIASVVAAVIAANEGYLLFTKWWALLFAAPFLGILVASRTKRQEPFIEDDLVLRHDGAARLEHWTHGIGTTVLIITGALLGLWFTKSVLGTGWPTLFTINLHYISAWFFLFGTVYYAANTFISRWRFKEHLPTKNFLPYTVQHYGHMLGIKKYSMPPEKKYFESEKFAYIIAVLSASILVVTGIVKVLAHAIEIPADLWNLMTVAHDISAIVIALFLLAHIFFGALLPTSWPGLHSMFSGNMPLDVVKKDYPGWYEELTSDKSDE
jgi:formate dehydrogenase subunit gamma